MNKNFIVLSASIIISAGIIVVASAANPFDISYPVSELGNCASQEECKIYCDNPDNQVACADWAAGKGFIEKKDAEKVREIQEVGNTPDSYGPGGCKSPGECDSYCRVLKHLDECLNYSVEKGFTSAEEAAKIRARADKKGPGGCGSREECDNFCKNPEHIEECMNFAVEDGKIDKEEADFIIQRAKMYGGPNSQKGKGPKRGPQGPKIDEEKAKQVLESKGGGPGGCKGMDECASFCSDLNNAEECTNFAVENGFMLPKEAEKAKKMMTMGGPGGCKGPGECDAFCSKEENRDECFKFAKESGMMPPEEVQIMEKEMEIVKKLERRGGPGGCKDPRECKEFCGNPENAEICMNFASQNGMIKKDEAEMRMRRLDEAQSQMQIMDQDRENFMEMRPPERFKPLEGIMPFPPPTGKFEGQEFPGQGEPFQGGQPPPGVPWQQGEFMRPPEGFEGGYEGTRPEGAMPPEGMMQPPANMMPPNGEMFSPPPSPSPMENLPGVILKPFLDIFR